jgi:hypothetical protein
MYEKSRMIPPGSLSAAYHEEVDYQKKGECREGCLKVALEQLPCAERHQKEYKNEEQDNRQFFKFVGSCFFHYCSNSLNMVCTPPGRKTLSGQKLNNTELTQMVDKLTTSS